MTRRWDVIIAGAGPAGSSLALRLARRGWRVLLIDAARFPRHKVCGEYLSAAAAALLSELGLDTIVARHAVPLDMLRIVLPDGRNLATRFDATSQQDRPSSVRPSSLSRFRFDDLLLRAAIDAGVVFRDGLRVRQVHIDSNRARSIDAVPVDHHGATLSATADWIIAADGRHSIVVQQTGRIHSRDQQLVGFKQHFRLDPQPGGAQQRLEMHSLPGGYVGVSPLEDGLWNICGVLPRRLVQQSRGDLDAALRAWGGHQTPLAALLKSAAPQGPWLTVADVSTQRAVADAGNVLYIGDAAGTIEPLAGQGMTMALASAALSDQFLHDPARHAADYSTAWRRCFMPRIYRASLLAAALRRPRLMAGLPIIEHVNRRLAALLVDLGYRSVSANHEIRAFPAPQLASG